VGTLVRHVLDGVLVCEEEIDQGGEAVESDGEVVGNGRTV
jgi:hypothetical protein